MVTNPRKLPARYANVVLPFFLSVFMSWVVSLVATLNGVGFSSGVFWLWMSAWGLSWIIAFPTLLVVLPLVRRLTALVVDAPRG